MILSQILGFTFFFFFFSLLWWWCFKCILQLLVLSHTHLKSSDAFNSGKGLLACLWEEFPELLLTAFAGYKKHFFFSF